ncbi:glycine radical domain-containing protein, partial [Shigella sonnei]|nr:glycine radical domain-containing protein [Shigella sonnei]
VVNGKKTGNPPDGRRAGAPLGPGATPMHGRDQRGYCTFLTSVAKLPFAYERGGVGDTNFSVRKREFCNRSERGDWTFLVTA